MLGQAGLARFLLSKGADVNARDGDGRTPLMVSASAGGFDHFRGLATVSPWGLIWTEPVCDLGRPDGQAGPVVRGLEDWHDIVVAQRPVLRRLIDAGDSCITRTDGCLPPSLTSELPKPLTNDQRGTGYPRLVGSAVDIGAIEVNYQFGSAVGFNFSQATYTVNERDNSITITVGRTGDTSQAASVDYATDDGSTSSMAVPCSAVAGLALERCDYTRAAGTLSFAAGDVQKSFTVLVNDDSYAEGPEVTHLRLLNPVGAQLAQQSSATLQLADDTQQTTNPLGDTAFFLSIEFQETGFLVERIYKTAFGDAQGTSSLGGMQHAILVPIVRFNEFLPATQRIGQGVIIGQSGADALLEANKSAFALEFVRQERFLSAFPLAMTPAQVVDTMNQNAGSVLTQEQRDALVAQLTASSDVAVGRAGVLRQIAENATLKANEKNRAFVLGQYFGYLRRNPNDPQDTDYTGYEFWLQKLNEFNGNFVQAEMVKAFISSEEYRKRFGQ